MKRWVFCSDVHGDQQDPVAVNALFRFVREWKPHYRICGGDVWDFRALRRKASEEEKRESLKADFEAGLSFLEEFRPTTFLRGNHDERLWDLARNQNGPLSDLASDLAARSESSLPSSCVLLPYHKRLGVFGLGNLKCLHGYFAGPSAGRNHAQAYGSCLYGHIHAIDEASVAGLERRVARSTGCLCRLDMEYDRASVGSLRHQHGFAYGTLNEKTGATSVFQAECVEGKFVVASDVRSI